MKDKLRSATILALTVIVLLFTSKRLPADTDTCGGALTTLPFTDVMGNTFFCSIAEAFFSGLTNGTTPTTYTPSDFVRRDQMSAFVTRTQDSAVRRGSRRAALVQWATPPTLPMTSRTTVGGGPDAVASDGADLWVANGGTDTVTRVRASDGIALGTWTGARFATGVLVARGRVYVTGTLSPAGALYVIDPSAAPGPVTTRSSSLGAFTFGIATDGSYMWTANEGNPGGSISKVDPDTGATTNVTTGFSHPFGILFDGANLWVTDVGDFMLRKLDSNGNVVQNVTVGAEPEFPVFDGSNIWVPNLQENSITVVRVRDGMVLATLSGNGLNKPDLVAFDGQRILVTNSSGDTVSLWNATSLTPIGSVSTGAGTGPYGACSDGINFWITLQFANKLARL